MACIPARRLTLLFCLGHLLLILTGCFFWIQRLPAASAHVPQTDDVTASKAAPAKLAAPFVALETSARLRATEPDSITRAQLIEAYGKAPLGFVANQGQADSRVQFLARGSGYNLFLTPTEAVLTLRKHEGGRLGAKGGSDSASTSSSTQDSAAVLRMRLSGSDPSLRGEGVEELPGKSNYFVGNDPSRWLRDVPNYAKVRYESVYRGVDLEYYGNQSRLEYDFVVAPGADPRVIKLSFEGARKIEIDEQGNLVLHTASGDVRQGRPLIYQTTGGVKKEVGGGYVLEGRREVSFALDSYDASRPLVIDPVLSYSSYLGGSSADAAYGIAVDSSGNTYLTGETYSTNFPGTFNPVYVFHEAFVTKLNATGSGFIYSTYLGGGNNEIGNKITVDSNGNAYVVGTTDSDNFPVTPGCYQSTIHSVSNAFVTKFNATGSILYSTYLGGNGSDYGRGIAVDPSGNAYVTGATYSTTFPTTSGAFQTTKAGDGDVFVTKLNSAGTALIYSTYLGGTNQDEGHAISVDTSGNAYVTGFTYSTSFPKTLGAYQTSLGSTSADAFVTKLNDSGSALVYSTFLGGSSDDFGYAIAIDSSGHAYVTGETFSSNFPTSSGAFQTSYFYREAFVTKLNVAGSALDYSTLLGGNGDEVGRGIAVDSSGNARVVGSTDSTNFPQAHQLQQPNANFGSGSVYDAFVVKMNAAGTRPFYSVYLGGGGNDFGRGIALDAAGNAYVTGSTESTNFPTLNPVQAAHGDSGSFTDGFVTKLLPARYNIGGHVTNNSGGGVAGVTLSLTGTQSATTQTNANGDYLFTGLEEGGFYVVTPSGVGRAFTPLSRALNDLGGDQTANFTTVKTGTATAGLYRPADSIFYLKNSNQGGPADSTFGYGPAGAGWTPLVGDWDGNGTATVGLYDPATANFYLKNTNTAGPADMVFSYGPAGAGWKPVVGDWNGDGIDTVGLYNPSSSFFFLKNTNAAGSADVVFSYGPAGAGWTPLTCDWNGDGVDTVGLYNPADGTFYLKNTNAAGPADLVFSYGPGGAAWIPLVGDWNGDGVDTIGVYYMTTGTFFLRNENSVGPADVAFFEFGPGGAGWIPLVGNWDGP